MLYQKREAVSESGSRHKCVCFGVFFSGPPFQILQAWRDGNIQLITSPEILDEYRHVGEMLAEEHPVIDLEPMLEYVIHNAVVFFSPRFLNAFVTIRMTINFLPVRWQAEVISLSAATGIFSKCQDNKTLKS